MSDGLRAEQQRGGELLLLLAEVGGVLLGLEDGAVHIQPGDVSALLPLELEIGEALGVPDRLGERAHADLGGGHLGDALQQVEPALAQRLQGVEHRGIPGGAGGVLAGAALADLHRLAEGEAVVRDVGELVEPGRVGGPDGKRAPLEVEARIGPHAGPGHVGLGQADLGARGDEVR